MHYIKSTTLIRVGEKPAQRLVLLIIVDIVDKQQSWKFGSSIQIGWVGGWGQGRWLRGWLRQVWDTKEGGHPH